MLGSRVIAKIESITIRAQKTIVNRLMLFDFAESAIGYFCKDKARGLEGYDFKEIGKRFRLVGIREDRATRTIGYKEIESVGNDFIRNELADSIFILNVSTFENWVLTSLKTKFMEERQEIYPDKEKKVDLAILRASSNLDEVWEKVIDEDLKSRPYAGMRDLLKFLVGRFHVKWERMSEGIGKITEISLCRNAVVHNQKIVDAAYVKKSGKFARLREGATILIDENILIEQADNLLAFMQCFRKELRARIREDQK